MLVWDNHVCMPVRPQDVSFMDQLEWHHHSGTDVVMLNVGFGDDSIEAHMRMLATFRAWLAARPAQYRLIRTVADIHAAKDAGQLAVGFDIEGANAIGDQLSLIGLYRELGVCWMLLAYNQNNRAGGGCQDEDTGLTPFGRAMLEEMARVGMIACCSHTGYRTAREAIDASPAPLIFSHSNPRALHDHPRNIPDELIRACAARGGVIGINGIGTFLGNNDASPANLARHVMHVAELVGVQHVGIGLDFIHDRREIDDLLAANPDKFPPHLGYASDLKMMAPQELPTLAAELGMRGMNDVEIAAVFGGNWLRVAEQIWRE
ncbi:membrane dipeptidase (plasmid) [Variovorax paradoxus]|nr:membrane dipeptidase [Variovorax paradoxus]